ncbi:cytidine deaminase [Actinocorallia sp. A-T 12471]|uniref:cytidine deaminase n=1 Tax=Actinocorallia sp. A-T 12471 TaxID=3089813 RepID=UPI0029D04F20|nr:cytidine deaminase [Actinocorallia sp. A-T 12471]MDX6743507.1 cytidine deaminase [Actinocorallia sp. A-T 12471]
MNPEDEKLIKLARATRARNGAEEGAAVRDETGRTYTASTVALPSLALTALQTAVAMAVASGAEGLEAAVVVTAGPAPDVAAVRDLSQDAPVLVCGLDGAVRETV